MPAQAARAAESFSLLTGFVATELGRTGPAAGHRPVAGARGDRRLAGFDRACHALGEAPVLAECFKRMERTLGLATA
jgi:hypothetical protein